MLRHTRAQGQRRGCGALHDPAGLPSSRMRAYAALDQTDPRACWSRCSLLAVRSVARSPKLDRTGRAGAGEDLPSGAGHSVNSGRTGVLPGPLRQKHTVPMIMTPRYFNDLNDHLKNLAPPLPDKSRVGKGARLQVDQMIRYSDPTHEIRYGRGHLTDLDEDNLTVYIIWDESAETDNLLLETDQLGE